ncbi:MULTISPECIES: cupin domain-containing protein [unclassified Meiothermus]|uniref:cupin domain-containing protein n=1 Tax=unclassified Meiothermus TaxID=370471 RepID=UPI000D7CB3B6|nr:MULTISPECIES: cupin domain-containing protein [unclassified Meiothermus]PZA08243.1 hypothetical protein DNA98_03635 [Meiothermus sp. Pnk-1]RYM38985.1 cupin domain-containing protein [Meiothermus sp. PNK-Is4]
MTSAEVIRILGLKPHPEGGHYIQTFKSPLLLEARQGQRAASTAIYFLLEAGDFSAWHRVCSDEVWHFYAGGGLELHLLSEEGVYSKVRMGSNLLQGERPQAVVPAGVWQAACPVGNYALVGCTVAPGFEFADFELPSREELGRRFPQHAELIARLTR